MRLVRVQGRNLFSLGPFRFDLASKGMVAVRGINYDSRDAGKSNGSGKSALVIESVFWGLFGVAVRKCKVNEVVRRGQKDSCLVITLFEADDGRKVKIKRERSSRASTLRLFVDGKAATRGTIEATQEAINKLLGFDVNVGRIILMLGKQATEKAWPEMSDQKLKLLFDDALGMHKMRETYDLAKRKLSSLERMLSQVEVGIGLTRDRIEGRNAHMSSLQSAIASYEEERVAREQSARRDIERAELYLRERRRELEAFNESPDKLKAKLAKAQGVKQELFEKLNNLPVCKTCGQEIGGNEITSKIGDIKVFIVDTEREINRIERDYAALDREVTRAEALLSNAKLKLSDIGSGVSDKLLVEMEDKQREVGELKRKLKAYLWRAGELRREISTVGYLAAAYSPTGIPAMKLDEITPTLNLAAKYYASLLTNDINITFQTVTKGRAGELRESFSVSAKGRDGTPYSTMSIGERQGVNLACSMAFRRAMEDYVGQTCNVLMCDEAFEGLDLPGQVAVMELLLSETQESVFVLTHREALARMCNNVVTVEKRGGVSGIKE